MLWCFEPVTYNDSHQKLAKRVTTRKDFAEYSSPMFDAAFQLECMSSEESSDDSSAEMHSPEDGTHHHTTILRIRYLAWRSERLRRLYQILDEKEDADRSQKPRRGVGRKVRQIGLPKDGNPPPPKGVPRWMVSKKWIRDSELNNPFLASILRDILGDTSEGVSWDILASLGDESDLEAMQVHPTEQLSYPGHVQGQWTDGYFLS